MDHQVKRMRKHENGAVTSSIPTSSLSSSSVAAASSSSSSSSSTSSSSSLDLGLSLGLAMLAPQLGSPSSAAMLASPGPTWSPSGCSGLPLALPPPPPQPSSSGCSSSACSSAASSSTYSSAGSCCASTSSSSSPLQKTMYPPGPSFSGYARPQGAHHHHLGLLAQESARHQMLHQQQQQQHQQHQRDQQIAHHDHVRVKRERGDCSGCAAAAWRESCETAVLYGMHRGAAASLLSRAHTVTTSASHGSICWAGVGSGPAAGAVPATGPGPGPNQAHTGTNGNSLKSKTSHSNSSQRYSSSWHDRTRSSPQTPLSKGPQHEDSKQTRATLSAHQDVLSRLPPLPPPTSHMCDMMMTTPSVDATDLSARCFKAPLGGYTGLDCTKQPKEAQSAARQKITTSKDRAVNVMDNRAAASLMTSHANGSSPYDMVPPEPLEGHGFPCGLPHLTDSMGHPMPPHYMFDWPAHAHPSHFPSAAHMSLTAAHPGYLLPSQHHPPHPSPPHLTSEHPSGMGLGSLMTSRPSLSPMNCSTAPNGRHGQVHPHPEDDAMQMNGRRQEGDKSKGKHSEGSNKGSSSIPVGIAVARQRRENKRRNAANGEECRTPSEECSSRNAELMCQDAKELSRRKVLYRHPLEVVTAGGSSAPCVPWEDIPKSVAPSMQSHWMPPSHHSLGQTLWLNQGPYPPVSVQISPMEPGHPPFPPFGYQLSRDPITGHFLLIPAANLDLMDRPGMWPSLAPSSLASPASHHPLHPFMLHQPTFLHQPAEIPKPCDYSLGLVRQAKMEEQSEGLGLEDEKSSPTVDCNVDRKVGESLLTVPPVLQPPISEQASPVTTLESGTSRSEQKKERIDPVLVSSSCLTYPQEFPPSPNPMPFFHPSPSSSDRSADAHKRSQGTSPVNPGTCLTPVSEPGDATLEEEATSNDTATALTASVTTNTPPDYYAFDASACTDNPGTPCSDGGTGTKSEPLMADASNQTETPPLTEEEESLGDMGEYDEEEEEEEMLDVGHCRECDQGMCVEVEREYVAASVVASQQMETQGEPADVKADPSEPSNASEDIDVEVVEDVPVVGDEVVEVVDVCTTHNGLELLSNSILEHEQAHRTSCIRIPQDEKLEDASNCASDKLDAPNGCPADSRESAGGLSILCALAEQRIKEETLVVGPVKCNSNLCVSVESDATVIPIDEYHAEGGGSMTATAKSMSRTPQKEFKLFIAHKISQYAPLAEEKCQQVQPQAAVGSTVVATNKHDKETMDTAEFQMRLRLAELQKQYREKQKELAKLQPRKEKVPVVPGATVLVGSDTGDLSPVKRGPGRPRKRKLAPISSGVPVKIVTTAITTSVTTTQITVPMITGAKKEAEDARKLVVVAKPSAVLATVSSAGPTTTSHFKMGRPILKPPTLITHKLAYTPHMLLTNVTNAKARYLHTLQPWERMATVHPPVKTSVPVAARAAKPAAAMTSGPKANASNKLERKHLPGHHQPHRHRHRNRLSVSKQQRCRVMINDSSSSDDFDDTETSSSDEEVVRPSHRISVAECKEAKQVIGRFVPGNSTRFVLPYCCDEVQGLGLLARYAAENVEQTRSNTGSVKRKMVAECGSEDTRMLNRDANGALVSSSKKRKPGRPKKHSSSPNEDATETIVAKTPKMMPNYAGSSARMGKPKSEMSMKIETASKRSLQNQQQHSFLEDEAWLRRRSERIFLSESVALTTSTNSNTSPTAISSLNQSISSSNSGNNHVSNSGHSSSSSSCISTVTSSDTKKIVAPSSFKLANEEQPLALPPSKFKSEESANKVCIATPQLSATSKKSDTVNRVKKRSPTNTKSLKMETLVPTSSTSTKPKKSSSKERERDVPEELFEALKQKCRLNDSNQKGGLSPRDTDYEDVDSNSTVSSSHSVASSASGCVNPLSGNSSSYSEGENLPLIQLVERTATPEPRSCVIGAKELGDKLRVLALMDGLFYAGHINAIRAPDVYGVTIDGERGNRPHIYSREEILKEAILEVKPGSVRYLPEGTRVCAYWSQQYRCLYPGTVAKSTSPNPTADKKYVNVEFDDGDSGKIPVADVRLLPHDFPNISYDPNPLMLLGKRRTKASNDVAKGDGSKNCSSFNKHGMQRSGNSSSKQFHESINKKKKSKKNTGSAPKVMTNCSPNENTNGKETDCTKRASSSGSKYMPGTSLTSNSNPERQPVVAVKHHKSDGNCKKPKKGNYLTDVGGRCKDPEEMKASAEGKSSKKRKKHKDRVVERKRHRHHHHHRSSSGGGSHYNRHQSHRYLHHKHRHKRAKKEQDLLPVPSAPARGVVAPGVMTAPVKSANVNVTQGFTIAEARKSELTVKIRTGGNEKEIRGNDGAAKHTSWHDSETSSSSNSPSEDSDTTTSSSSSSSSSSSAFLVSTNSNSSTSSDDMYFSRGSKNRKSQSAYRQKIDSNGKGVTSRKGAKRKERTVSTDSNKSKSMIAPFLPARQIWRWSGKSFKRPGIKGKARKEFYKAITRGKETIMVGDCAVFLSTGRPHLPYVGRIELMWKSWGGNMLVRVKWFYHPEETKGGRRLNDMKGALYQSPHADENDVQTISHKCEVLSWQDYTRRQEQQVGHGCNKYGSNVHFDNNDIYYLAGTYDPTTGEISMEPGVS